MFALGIFDYIKLGVGAVAGGAVIFVLGGLWLWTIHDPQVRADTTAVVQAANAKLTQEAIDEVAGQADKARAMRHYCTSVGKLFDFSAVKCRD